MPGPSRDVRTTRVALATGLRRHWLAAILLGAGLLLRAAAQLGYRPALFYIDTIRYLFDSQGNDPVGYRLPLKIILAAANFDAVAAVQHLLGLAMAVAIYLVLVRRGVVRSLAALAIAPVLLDAYQIQMEQMVLPDVWFEALIVAGIAVLLARPAPPGLRAVIAGGLLLGISATFRQVGEILLLPALAYLLIACSGWRTALGRAAALAGAFALPVLGYMAGSYALTGNFYLAHTGVTSTYGRMAWSAAWTRLAGARPGLADQAVLRRWQPAGRTGVPPGRQLQQRGARAAARPGHRLIPARHGQGLRAEQGDQSRRPADLALAVPGQVPVLVAARDARRGPAHRGQVRRRLAAGLAGGRRLPAPLPARRWLHAGAAARVLRARRAGRLGWRRRRPHPWQGPMRIKPS